MIKTISRSIIALSISATSLLAAESLPEGFSGINDPAEKEKRAGIVARGLPLFPILGLPEAPVKIDYFYSSSCEPCRQTSKSIFEVLANDKKIQVSFHPLPSTQSDYDSAVAETVLYSASPVAFSMFHFVDMTSNWDAPKDTGKLLSEIAALSKKSDVVWARMENYEDWTTNLKVSQMIADEVGVSSLPTMIIGDRKYEGFVSHDAFLHAIDEIIEDNDEE
jgi:protein-disulfide isomerase